MGASRAYDVLLRAYPPAFRARFEIGLRDAFAHEHAAARARGARATIGFWSRTILDTAASGALVRFHVMSRLAALRIDLREAWRSLRATPLVAAVIILSVALGVGANTAIFSVLDSLALKTLPVRAPEQLFQLNQGGSVWWTNPLWEQIRARDRDLFDGALAWTSTAFDLATSGQSNLVPGAYVSGGLFDVLGLAPARGRLLTDADDVRGGGPDGPAAVVSYDFWQQHLGGSNDVVGRPLSLSHVPFTIVGVAPRGFSGLEVGQSAQVFIPIGTEPLILGTESAFDNRLSWWLRVVVRTKPGQSLEEAMTLMRTIQPQVRAATLPASRLPPAQLARYLTEPFSLTRAANGGGSTAGARFVTPLTAMLVVVGLVLLIACVNIANLLLARAAARRKELSLRLALGSSRGRLARQLLLESVLLAGTGGVLGFALAQVGSRVFVRQLMILKAPLFLDLTIDWRVFAFAAAVTLVMTIVFGLGPAFIATRVTPAEAIITHGRGVAGDRRRGARSLLVVVQVALSLVPIAAAGLFIHTFSALVRVPLGMTPDPILLASVPVANVAPADRQALFDRLEQAAAAVPGVRRAALSLVVPFTGIGWRLQIEIDGRVVGERDVPRINSSGGQGTIVPLAAPSGQPEMTSWINGITPGWFDVYGMHLVAGRGFRADDRADAPHVAIVNEAFSRAFFNGQSLLGHQVLGGLDGSGAFTKVPFEIVGVVSDARYRSMREDMMPTVYVPLAQVTAPEFWVSITPAMSVAAAAGTPSAQLAHDLAGAFGRVNPRMTLFSLTLDDEIRGATMPERLAAIVSGAFGGLALLLAAIGLYGVTAYAVNRRRAELGVRMTLGARPRDVVRLVLGRVGWLVGAGVVIGAALAFWAARFVSASLLFGVKARDVQTFLAAAIVLAVVGVLAAWLPARRAARIDPREVLRES